MREAEAEVMEEAVEAEAITAAEVTAEAEEAFKHKRLKYTFKTRK